MNTYMIAKHLHMTLALISIAFFITRSIWAFMGSGWLQKKWVKISPHIIDTFLLASALFLLFKLQLNPFSEAGAWVAAKIIALIAYIVLGVFTLKKAKNNQMRSIFFALALVCFGYIVAVARMRTPLPF